jgi:hypothetical protein
MAILIKEEVGIEDPQKSLLKLINKLFYLSAFSTIVGIILLNSGQDSSRQGFVFTSISQTLKFSSIMKSSPNTFKKKYVKIYYLKTI